MSTFSSDAQSFFSMTKNESNGKAEKKQKGECHIGQWHARSESFFENNLKHRDGGGTDKLIQNAVPGKNVDRAIFVHDFVKIKQETRSIRSSPFSREKVDFHLLMALAFHDLL